MSAQETKLLAIMRADREVQDRRDRREITYASLRQRRATIKLGVERQPDP